MRRSLPRSVVTGRLNDAVAASLLWTVFPASEGVVSRGLLVEDDGIDLSTDTAESRAVITHGGNVTSVLLSAAHGAYAGMAATRSVSLAFRGAARLPQAVTVGTARVPALSSPPAALGQRGFTLLPAVADQQVARAHQAEQEVPEGPLVLPPGTLLVALGAVRVSDETQVTVVW